MRPQICTLLDHHLFQVQWLVLQKESWRHCGSFSIIHCWKHVLEESGKQSLEVLQRNIAELIWYVDDTQVKTQTQEVESFTEHMNSIWQQHQVYQRGWGQRGWPSEHWGLRKAYTHKPISAFWLTPPTRPLEHKVSIAWTLHHRA